MGQILYNHMKLFIKDQLFVYVILQIALQLINKINPIIEHGYSHSLIT